MLLKYVKSWSMIFMTSKYCDFQTVSFKGYSSIHMTEKVVAFRTSFQNCQSNVRILPRMCTVKFNNSIWSENAFGSKKKELRIVGRTNTSGLFIWARLKQIHQTLRFETTSCTAAIFFLSIIMESEYVYEYTLHFWDVLIYKTQDRIKNK